ncbi:MAG: chromosome segregation ATPase [Luteibaculaceae bacterium]|jgi:chromosome segregation ATPase
MMVGCTWKSEKEALAKELEEIRVENEELSLMAGERDSAIVDFLRAYDEIESSIGKIKNREKKLKKSVGSAEGKAVQERILDDFKQINELIVDNNKRIQDMTKTMAGLKGENNKLNELIGLLRDELTERVAEVEGLKEELMMAYEAFDALNELYVESVGAIEEKENEINSAFYAIGSFKELKENNVLEREAGLSGLVGGKSLNADLNTAYFKQIDRRMVHKIETFGGKTKLATTHPDGSYEWQPEGENNNVLVIKDPEQFWSISKYLVIVVG